MAGEDTEQEATRSRRGWSRARSFGPLATWFALGMALLVFVLPNSLVVPQTNPNTVPEFAPVPPDEDSPPASSDGPLSSLGLPTSGGVGDVPPPPLFPGGSGGKNPITNACVGSPPRQTSDPLSPPCVPFFIGDNGGATAPGVTANEVRVLFYFDARTNTQITSRGTESCECEGEFVDLALKEQPDDYVFNRMLRRYMLFFNDRFETYKRFVHFHMHYGTRDENAMESPGARRADAARGYDEIKPFAVVVFAGENSDVYARAMADKGVAVFLGSSVAVDIGQPAELYRDFPGRIWSFFPTLEQRAEIFSSYVCRKVVPNPVSFSGNLNENSKERRLGLLRVTDPNRPDLTAYADLIKRNVQSCGGKVWVDRDTPIASCGPPPCQSPADPAQNVAAFRQANVTTIIHAGGSDADQTAAASAAQYYPERIIAGEGFSETTENGQEQPATVWRYARLVTNLTYEDRFENRHCVRAIREVDPTAGSVDIGSYGCDYYPSVRQLFTGIQVAGPRLTVAAMDRGFHSIPAVPSKDPSIPACFYGSGDYACVKDAAAAWWDVSGTNENNTQGCWRVMQAGRRYLAGTWPAGNVDAQRSNSDPCSLYGRHNQGYGAP